MYCKVLFHYTVPAWKSTLLVIGIWNIIYWGPHLCPQPTCMLFLLYHLWVLVHLNYRDIKQLSHKGGGGRVTGPPGPPPSYAPDEEKKILPSLVYVLNKTWNLAFSCPGRAVMAKKMYKKSVMHVQSCCFAYSFQPIAFLTFSLSSLLWRLQVPNDDFFMLSLLVHY